MKKFLSITIIAIIALIGLTVSVDAVATQVTTQEGFMTAVENKEEISIEKDLTIKLEKDITINQKVTIGTWGSKSNTVILDLNGHTVKLDGSISTYFYVQNTGTLEIKDSAGGGKITNAGATNTASNSYLIQVKGNIIINGGTIENTIASKTALYIQNGDNKAATCILNEGTIKNTWDKSGRAVQVGKNATFTMNGGEVINKAAGTYGTVPAIEGQSGKIIINGGTIESAGTGVYSTVEVLITGGTIDAGWFAFEGRDITVAPAEGKTVKVSAGEITDDIVAKEKAAIFKTMSKAASLPDAKNEILGGEFKAPRVIATSSLDDTNAEISGGSFNIDVTEFIDEDSVQMDDGNGNKIVVVPVKLDTPANLKWDGTKATWDAVPNAASYVVIVCDEHGQITEDIVTEDTSVDLAEYLTDENKEYIFVVIADSDTPRYLASTGAESETYVFPVEDDKEDEPTNEDVTQEQPGEDIKDEETSQEGTSEQEPEEDEKDDTPATGSIDIVLFASAIVAVISIAGIVTVKKYTR